MFGIQWDLVIKHLKNKGISTNLLTEDSSGIGNYQNTKNITLLSGMYTPYMKFQQSGPPITTFNTWSAYNENLGEIVKNSVLNNASMPQTVLLTTGASNQFNQKNIYDLAGNVSELILEKAGPDRTSSEVSRGGAFCMDGGYFEGHLGYYPEAARLGGGCSYFLRF